MCPTRIVCMFLCLLILTLSSCGSETENEEPDTGGDCTLDEDCEEGLVCEASSTCQICQSCEVRADCQEGYSCSEVASHAGKCCKQVQCSEDFDCDDPMYCLELICRQKPCQGDADCGRDMHYCFQAECRRKECETHEDCASGLCDTVNYQCLNCSLDVDCPGEDLICSGGNCVENPISTDGDGIGDLKGCDEFKAGCLYEAFLCFDKINPSQSYSSCAMVTDDDGIEGYGFTFADGSVWLMYGQPPSYHIARGVNGYCYKLRPTLVGNDYYDASTERIGTYLMDPTKDHIQVTCADGSKEWYDPKRLRSDHCPGFQESGVYYPPTPPGLEGCERLE